MKKIKIEGELKIELERQIKNTNALHSEIQQLSITKYEIEKRMWEQLKKEFPDQSNNCTLSNENGEIIFTDRLAD